MPYTDLLRASVFITAAEATALGAITALAANRDGDTTVAVVAAVWWLVAPAIGVYLGRPQRAAHAARGPPPRPRPPPSRPAQTPPRIPLPRLWPIAFTAIAAGVLGIFFP